MHYVLVLVAVVIVVILACVVVVATGRGGEIARFPNDYAPPDLRALAATDVALLRPPTALWGYNMQATDEALSGIASALTARDVRIASLERQLAELRAALSAAPRLAEPGYWGSDLPPQDDAVSAGARGDAPGAQSDFRQPMTESLERPEPAEPAEPAGTVQSAASDTSDGQATPSEPGTGTQSDSDEDETW